jgi:hypothetical protein
MKKSLSNLVILLAFATTANADPLRVLSPLELFSRCYTHITQLRLPPNHPKRAAVVAGTLSPVDACMAILAEANIVTSGTNEGNIATPVTVNGINESLAVLQNFNSLHLNFTSNSDLVGAVPQGVLHPGIRAVVDETEFALHYTRALFAAGEPVNQLLVGTNAMEAIRSGGRNTTSPVTPLGVQIGTFLGVRKMPADKTAAVANIPPGSIAFNAHNGGGVIGTYSDLALNFGSDTRTPNGGLAMPRRWAKQIFHDVLCRDVPVIRVSDGTAKIHTTVTTNTPQFRKTGQCMSCHASMDPAAATARNYNFYIDYRTAADAGTWATFLFKNVVSKPAETAVVDSDSSFYLRPPNGAFVFRSYDGTLTDVPVTSIADLGAKMAATNDFYACTASRYFRYFTGINANLQDIGDTSRPPLSTADLYYRNLVIQFGLDLKSSQNLQTLIRDILSSAPYKKSSLRSDGN